MDVIDLKNLDVRPHQPAVVASHPEARAIVVALPAGESLGDHEVRERAFIVVLDGEVELTGPGGADKRCGPGLLAVADPHERHAVRAVSDARLLLLLAPWPAEDHQSGGDVAGSAARAG